MKMIILLMLTVILCVACDPPPPLKFSKGDCVVHTLDKDTEGLVIGYHGRYAIPVRFSINSDPRLYHPNELKHCDED